eukprot:14103458-Heterocapsa_arctica.AAC.1
MGKGTFEERKRHKGGNLFRGLVRQQRGRLTFRLKEEQPSMDTQKGRIYKLTTTSIVYLARNVQEHMLKNYIIYIQHTL